MVIDYRASSETTTIGKITGKVNQRESEKENRTKRKKNTRSVRKEVNERQNIVYVTAVGWWLP